MMAKKKLTKKCNKVQANISWPPGRFQTLLDLSIPWPGKRFAGSLSHHLKICFSLCCVILCDFYLKIWRKLHVPDSCSRLYIQKQIIPGSPHMTFSGNRTYLPLNPCWWLWSSQQNRGHEVSIHRGSCWQRTAVIFVHLFSPHWEQNNPICKTNNLFSKVTCKGVNTNAYSYPFRKHIYLS